MSVGGTLFPLWLIGALALALPAGAGDAATLKTIHSFTGGKDGGYPYGGLVAGADGALYGTTTQGGEGYDGGTVFKLTPPEMQGGAWTERTLYSFCLNISSCPDGGGPRGRLVLGADGALYGTTQNGGTLGLGVVFKLTPSVGGAYSQKLLYTFCAATGCIDGAMPMAGLIMDSQGALYGTTDWGGTGNCAPEGCGTVFELTPGPNGTYTESVLYSFAGPPFDGAYTVADLIMDSGGALYGTTNIGGTCNFPPEGCGTVFKLTPVNGGAYYSESLLYVFGGPPDGENPVGGLVAGSPGTLFGATELGGAYNYGTAFELTPGGVGGSYTESILHSFNLTFHGPDGANPASALFRSAGGELYGTTPWGGAREGGTVFKLASGAETVLHSFSYPMYGYHYSALISPAPGVFYGTSQFGGAHGKGEVFELRTR